MRFEKIIFLVVDCLVLTFEKFVSIESEDGASIFEARRFIWLFGSSTLVENIEILKFVV